MHFNDGRTRSARKVFSIRDYNMILNLKATVTAFMQN